MKRIYPVVLTLITAMSLQAQLTQSNHAPAAGDQYTTLDCGATGPGASGAGTVWNFSSVPTLTNAALLHSGVSVSSATYANATVAMGTSVTDISYYKSSANDLLYYGGNLPIAGYSVSINYTTAPAVYASYPMTMGTTSTAVIGGSINVTVPTTAAGPFTGTCRVIADGTGTLILPGGVTYTNVLRVLTSQTISATIILPVTVNQETYNYYAPTIKAPIFTIASTTLTSFSGPSTQTMVTRNKDAVGTATNTTGILENSAVKNTFSVYPNPSTTFVTILAHGADAAQALIYDVTGKMVDRASFTDGKAKLDVSEYNKGLYFFTVIASDNSKLGGGKITVSQ
ncbi:MAG: T9SS type A sorting domain-containing protein [bacterium]|nr:T9SS type A sorting domain-containing protein [bacterium]